MSFLVLVAAVMKADGRIMKSELDYVKRYFVKSFGLGSAKEAMIILRDLLKQEISLNDIAGQIGDKLDYASKLQMIHLLFNIADADGSIHPSEMIVLERIYLLFNIDVVDFESIKAMVVPNDDAAYKILEIDRNTSNDDVKKAYRIMANKYHPDKVEYLGDDFRETANEKFQKVNEAYNSIKKQRKFN